jgi:hypothetical protein
MNHRDMMTLAVSAAGNKFRSSFLKIPIELQDEIMDGLDNGAMTTIEAAALVKKAKVRGVSAMSINRYYNLFCHQRQLFDLDNIVMAVMDRYVKVDARSLATATFNMLLSEILQGISNRSIKWKSKVDPVKLVDSLIKAGTIIDRMMPDGSGLGGPTVDLEAKRKRIDEIYGLTGEPD